MVRYDNHYTIRMNEKVKDSLKRYCAEYRVKESEFVRNSIEKCLVSEMQNVGRVPEFPTLFKSA